MSKILNKHWDILQIDYKIKNEFVERPIVAYKRNKNLKDFIGSNKIENDLKVVHTRPTKIFDFFRKLTRNF